MAIKLSTVIIGTIDIDVDALKAIDGVTIFKVTDRKSCEDIVGQVTNNDVVFIIADGREVYYAEKFFAKITPLKIFLVTEAQAADNKNLQDVIIQLPAQNFKKSAYEIANVFNDVLNVEGLLGLNFDDVKTLLKDSGKAIATIGEGKSVDEAVSNALDGCYIKSAQAILVNFKATKDAAVMTDVNAALEKIKSSVNENAKCVCGVTADESLGDNVKVAIIATKFN